MLSPLPSAILFASCGTYSVRPQHYPPKQLCQPLQFVPHSSCSNQLFPFLSLCRPSQWFGQLLSILSASAQGHHVFLTKARYHSGPKRRLFQVFMVSVICLVLWGWAIGPPPNPQPGGPGADLCLVSIP